MSATIEELQESVNVSKAEVTVQAEEKKAAEVCATTLQKEMSQLHEEFGTIISKLMQKDLQIQSMEGSQKDLEGQSADLQSNKQEVEHGLVQIKADHDVSNNNLSSLISEKKKLEESLATLQVEVVTARVNVVVLQTVLALKENLDISLTESHESKISDMAQKHADEQSYLEVANDLIQSVLLDKSDLEEALQQVQQILTSAEETSDVVKSWLEHKIEELQLEIHQRCEAQAAEIAQNERILSNLTEKQNILKSEFEAEKAKCYAIITELEKEAATARAELASTEKSLVRRSSQFEVCNNALSVTLSEKEQLVEKNKQLDSSMESLKLDTTTKQVELDEKVVLLNKKDDELSQLHSNVYLQKEIYQNEIAELESQLSSIENALAEKITKLTAEKQESKSALEKELLAVQHDLMREMENNKSEKKEIEISLSSSDKMVTAITVERNYLNEKLTVLQGECDAANKKYVSFIEKHKKTQKSTDEKLLLLEEANAFLQQRLGNESMAHKLASDKDKTLKNQLIEYLKVCTREQSRTSKIIDKLTQENNGLTSENNALKKKLTSMDETDSKDASECQRLKTVLTMERVVSRTLNEQLKALKFQLAKYKLASPRGSASSLNEKIYIPRILLASSDTSTSTDTLTNKPFHRSTAKSVSNSPADEEKRRELKQRNEQSLPHLKSSYPIEMQKKQETPSSSNNSQKNVIKEKEASTVPKTMTGVRMADTSPPWNRGNQGKKLGSRKRSRETAETQSCDKDQSSSITINTPPTPQTSASRYKHKTLPVGSFPICNLPMCSLNLKNILDDKKAKAGPSGTTFEVSFPRWTDKLAPVPKRFRGNRDKVSENSLATSTASGKTSTKKSEAVSETRRSSRNVGQKLTPKAKK